LSFTRSTRVLAAAALARAGDIEHAQKMADEVQKQNPLNTKILGYWLPTIRASIELSRHNPAKAIEILEGAAPYELGMPGPQPELGALFYPAYLRAQAFLALHQGGAAAGELNKYSDHKSIAVNSLLAALAPLGLARAYDLEGDTAKSRAAYKDFFARWKTADPDIPILRQAQAEYAKLSVAALRSPREDRKTMATRPYVASFNGTRAVIRVPSPGFEEIANSPPARKIRSRILINPSPAASRASSTSRPTPLSATSSANLSADPSTLTAMDFALLYLPAL